MSRAATKVQGTHVVAGLQTGQSKVFPTLLGRSKDRPVHNPIRRNVGAPTFSSADGVCA